MSVDLREYFPRIYDGVYETDQIIMVENAAMDGFYGAQNKAARNQFILTADEQGIEAFERIYKIIPNPEKEDLEFRRKRLLSRSSMALPFSEVFLRSKLDELIGIGKYNLSIDYNSCEVRIDSAASDANWYHEINVFMVRVKPANMVYVSNPYLESEIRVGEVISANQLVYNYRLGTKWALGQKPFAEKEELGVFKVAGTPSITGTLLNEIAVFTAGDVDNVLINDHFEITVFTDKQADQNKAIVAYDIPIGSVTEITNIKLRKGDAVLSESAVYIPVTEAVTLKHLIQFAEGV